MIVYHGGYAEIKSIDLSKANVAQDFGRGFYVTKLRFDAEAMAKRQGRDHNCKGFVSGFRFDYDTAFLSGFYKTKKFDGYTREWLDFIIANRKNLSEIHQVHEYDIIEGPIADDAVAARIVNLPPNPSDAEKDKLLQDLTYRDTHQICFCNEMSLQMLERMNLAPHKEVKKIGARIVKHLIDVDGITEKNARALYYKSDTYKNLYDEDTELYKKSWQEIYDILKEEIKIKQEGVDGGGKGGVTPAKNLQ